MDQFEYINEISKEKSRTSDILEYAFYLTLDFDIVCKGLKSNYKQIKIRDRLIKQLNKRFFNKDLKELINYFIDKLINSSGRNKISAGKILRELNDKISLEQRKRIGSVNNLSHILLALD